VREPEHLVLVSMSTLFDLPVCAFFDFVLV
jgi:hypothetical protein